MIRLSTKNRPRLKEKIILSILLLSIAGAAQADPLERIAKRLAKKIRKTPNTSVAVLAFPFTDGQLGQGSIIVQERLTTYLVQQDNITVIERRLLNEVLSDIKLQNSGIISLKKASDVGQMLGAGAVISGTINILPSRKAEVNARLIETESGKILGAERAVIKQTWAESPISISPPRPGPSNPEPQPTPPNHPTSPIKPSLLPGTAASNVESKAGLINIDFGVWAPNPSREHTTGANGGADEYWNTVAVAWNDNTIFQDLKFADGTTSTISGRLINLAGAWGADGKLGVPDLMLADFNYPQNNQGGHSAVILRNVPAGTYDIYIFGHLDHASYYGDYELIVGQTSQGRRMTIPEDRAYLNTAWQEGLQYVRFHSVAVKKGETVAIHIRPGGDPFHDTLISGLQLRPVVKPESLKTTKVSCTFQNMEAGALCYSEDGQVCETTAGDPSAGTCTLNFIAPPNEEIQMKSTCSGPNETPSPSSSNNFTFDCRSNSYTNMKGGPTTFSGAYWNCNDEREFFQAPGSEIRRQPPSQDDGRIHKTGNEPISLYEREEKMDRLTEKAQELATCLTEKEWNQEAAAVCQQPCSSGDCGLGLLIPFKACSSPVPSNIIQKYPAPMYRD